MLPTHQADLAQANLDLSVEASEPRKVAEQLAEARLPKTLMPLSQNQGYVLY